MKVGFTKEIDKQIRQLKRKDPSLYSKIQKQLHLFKDNPLHPSLRNHKLTNQLKGAWSISITKDFRMLYYWSGDKIVFYLIGGHDQVYKLEI